MLTVRSCDRLRVSTVLNTTHPHRCFIPVHSKVRDAFVHDCTALVQHGVSPLLLACLKRAFGADFSRYSSGPKVYASICSV